VSALSSKQPQRPVWMAHVSSGDIATPLQRRQTDVGNYSDDPTWDGRN